MPNAPTVRARVAGFAYIVTIAGGVYAQAVVRGRLVVQRDPEETARRIVAHATLFRTGMLADLAMLVAYVVVTALFFDLFTGARKAVGRTAAFFSLTGVAILASNLGRLDEVLLALGLDRSAAPTPSGAVRAYEALAAYGDVYGLSLMAFGCYCGLIGWLIVRSRAAPAVLGWLLGLAGVCYLGDALRNVAALPLPPPLPRLVLLPGLVGEGALAVWLLARGVRPTPR